MSDQIHRFSFEISTEQADRVRLLLDIYGIKKALFSMILDDVLDLIEKRGKIVIGAILSKAVKPREIVPILNKAERIRIDGDDRGPTS